VLSVLLDVCITITIPTHPDDDCGLTYRENQLLRKHNKLPGVHPIETKRDNQQKMRREPRVGKM
jgi:hypothetical protein